MELHRWEEQSSKEYTMLYHRNLVILWCLLVCSVGFFGFVQTQEQLIPYGSQQIFELTNKVATSDGRVTPWSMIDAAYTFQSHLTVNSVWSSGNSQLLEVYLSESTVSVPAKGGSRPITQQLTKIPDRPFYITIIDGQPSKVIAHTSRDQSLLNLKRGIASLLQLRRENGAAPESDVSGRCNVFYDVKSTTRIEKFKTDCTHWDLRVTYRPEKAFGVSQHSKEHINFELSADGALLKADARESHWFNLDAKPDVGNRIESHFIIEHHAVGREEVKQWHFATLDEAIGSLLEWFRVFDIESDADGAISEIKGKTLKQKIAEHAVDLAEEHVGSEALALTFANLLPLARITKATELVDILKAYETIQPQLVDLMGAAQTLDAYNAVHEVFEYGQSAHADLLEKYLQSLAVGSQPDRTYIADILKRLQSTEHPIKNEKLKDTLVQTVASLAHHSALNTDDNLHMAIRSFILEQMREKCKEIACKTRYIRALQNFQDTSTIPLLIATAMDGEVDISIAAMQALKAFPLSNFNVENRKAFAQIFYQTQRRYDSTARTIALDIMLALKPTKQQLSDLLEYLTSNDRHFEVKTYVVQKLNMLAARCPRFRSLLSSCLAEKPNVNNYDVFAQKGLTTVLMRELSQAPAFNESLLSSQEVYKGILKRGSVELILSAGRDEFSTFKLNIYTNGLTSFVGGSEDDEDDEESDERPSTAGMEISVQNVLLRPLVFFSGQTELMGHVWSGTASEPTSAYRGTTLEQDHENYIILSSGVTVNMRIIGFKSTDLNGKVELSIWNRNANTEIHQRSGAAVVGQLTAGFTYAKVEQKFRLLNEPNLSLQANIDFYSDIKLCMQLQRPVMTLRHFQTKSVFLNATYPYRKRINSRVEHKSAGQTLALNQKNNEMCNMIFE